MNDRQFAALLMALFVTVILGTRSATAEQQVAESRDESYMPEFYFYDPDQSYCALRLELSGIANAERKKLLLAIIDYAYAHTASWSQEYVMSGVDYVGFHYAHFISYRSCDESEGLISGLNQTFGMRRADWTEAEHSILVSTVEELNKLGPLGIFVRYKSKARVRHCLIRVPLKSLDTADVTYRGFQFLREKYRTPLADIDWANRNLNLLLSRQCEQKRAIYDQLLSLLNREKVAIDILGPADFNPSPYEYFYKYQCQLGLSDQDDTCKPQ